MSWAPYDHLKLAALLNGEASRIASGVVGHPVGVTVVTLRDVERMPFGRTEQWARFLDNHLQRQRVIEKARATTR